MRSVDINESIDGYEVRFADVTRQNFGEHTVRIVTYTSLEDVLYYTKAFLRTGYLAGDTEIAVEVEEEVKDET